MSQLLSPLLTLVLVYGYPTVFVIIILSYLGAPIPLDAVLLAAGSFTANGTLNFFALVILVAITSVFGDIIGYYLSRKYGYFLIKKTFLAKGLTEKRLNYLNVFLNRWGFWSIFTTRWLFTPLGVPLDIIAGLSKYSFKKFLISVALGEFIWAFLYIYLGNLFGANWQTVLIYINNVPEVLALLLLGIIFIYFGFKMWKKAHK